LAPGKLPGDGANVAPTVETWHCHVSVSKVTIVFLDIRNLLREGKRMSRQVQPSFSRVRQRDVAVPRLYVEILAGFRDQLGTRLSMIAMFVAFL
jgi:hypothetical protein